MGRTCGFVQWLYFYPDFKQMTSKVVVLGTGGTIAGTGAAGQSLGYSAGQLSVQALMDAVPALRSVPIEAEQVAQLDSKDMDHATWQRLAQRCAHHLARADVKGVVVTHGTDTLEETAYFLHRVLASSKPVVLTAAMRPATALSPDGPANLADAVATAQHDGAQGVLVALAGAVHAGCEVRKVHTTALDAFASIGGAVAHLRAGVFQQLRAWPKGEPLSASVVDRDVSQWPRVAVVHSHAGADGAVVDALVQAGVQGLVVAATGNGTVHVELQKAVDRAHERGVRVLRATRCAFGGIVEPAAGGTAQAQALTPAQARVALMLDLIAADFTAH
jgi:L-asparaginase